MSDLLRTMVATGRANDPPPAPDPSSRKEALPIMVAAPSDSPGSPYRRVRMALSILQQREASEDTIELAVMALRGADMTVLLAADEQMAG